MKSETKVFFQQILHCKSYIYISCLMKFDNLTKLFVLISCSKVEFFFRGSLFLSIQKQESSALFSTYITEGKFYISIVWQSSWKKENSYLILFWFQWWHKNSSWLTSQMSYGILIWTTEISFKEELKKTTKKKFYFLFISIMNHVKILL